MFRCNDDVPEGNRDVQQRPAVLLIHGFGGNRSEVRPLADHLRGSGFEVISVQLPGHREDRRELGVAEAKSKIWQDHVIRQLDELRRHSERVVIIGFSMGGLLAVQAVTRVLDREAAAGETVAMVTINTPVRYWNFVQIFRNIRRGGWTALKNYTAHATGQSVLGMWEFQKLLWRTKTRFSKISCPLFVIQSADDDTVWPCSAIHILRKSGERGRMMMFPEGGHQIFGSTAANEVCETIEEFVRRWASNET